MVLDPFFKGFIFGLLIAAPVGPIGILCIKRTLSDGPLSGFTAGLGAASADGFYSVIAISGLGILTRYLVTWQVVLQLFAGIIILILGIRFVLSKPVPELVETKTGSYLASYLTTFGLTLMNPMTILSFAAVFAGLGFGKLSETGENILLVVGVFFGSVSWWLLLAVLTGIIRRKVIMNSNFIWINRVAGIVLISFAVVLGINVLKPSRSPISSTLIPQPDIPSGDQSAFSRAAPGYKMVFPHDFGAHPDYQTEWWYYTGNLEDENHHRYGYQLTIFRRALIPLEDYQNRKSSWGTQQVYLGHFALSDVSNDNHYAFEMVERGAAGISGAQSEPFSVWIKDWYISKTGPDQYHLYASAWLVNGDLVSINFNLSDEKGIVLHGDQGYSKKGPEEGNASYYFSMPRLLTEGEISIGNHTAQVGGLSWMDHEFSTSALSADQVGWDWFSVQLDDGSELMIYQIRKKDGSIDPYSSGTWIAADSKTVHLGKEDMSLEILDHWVSDRSGANYPSGWIMRIPKLNIQLEIIPLIVNQEMNLTYTYWEGAVRVKGSFEGRSLGGYGFVELTGYAGTMAGEF